MKGQNGVARTALLSAATVVLLATFATPAFAAPATDAGRHSGVQVSVAGGRIDVRGGGAITVTYGPGGRTTTIEGLSPDASWICSVYSSDPWKSSNTTVSVYASQSCSGSGFMPVQICDTVQRHRWFGWENMKTRCSGYAYVSFDDVTTTYNCAGTGSHSFNGAANGYAVAGVYGSGEVDSLHNPTFSC
jgi:hypothetical protein